VIDGTTLTRVCGFCRKPDSWLFPIAPPSGNDFCLSDPRLKTHWLARCLRGERRERFEATIEPSIGFELRKNWNGWQAWPWTWRSAKNLPAQVPPYSLFQEHQTTGAPPGKRVVGQLNFDAHCHIKKIPN